MINPWIIAAMVPAVTLLMLHLGVGPFGHPFRLHWHQAWRQKVARPIQLGGIILATLTLIIGTTHLLGFWTFNAVITT